MCCIKFIALMPGLVDLQKFMFSNRYHLKASALSRVWPSLTSFNRCRMSLVLLLLNAFLKVRAMYFKADSTDSGAFPMLIMFSRCTTHLHFLHNQFLRCEGPFSNEVGPSRFVWHSCHLLGSVWAFSQLLQCFSKLLAWLMVLLQQGQFSFLIWGSQWCCLSAASFEKNLPHLLHLCLILSIKHSIGCTICCISSSVAGNMALSWLLFKLLLQCIIVDLKKQSSLSTRANL